MAPLRSARIPLINQEEAVGPEAQGSAGGMTDAPRHAQPAETLPLRMELLKRLTHPT